MKYKEEKIKKFHEYTIKDYEESLIIDNLAKVELIEKTDGSFTQIGIRPLIAEDIFIDDAFSEYLPGAGRIVAIGERDFLINNILENKNIEKIKFNEDIREFPKHIEFKNAIIIISTKFYVDFFTKLANRIDYEERTPRLDRIYKVFSIPEQILGNKILIIAKDAIIWEKEKFHNPYTKKDEMIDINIVPKGDKAEITIRSVNRIKYLNPELIKILEVED